VDRRDDPTWAALELSRVGELKIEDGSLEDLLQRDLDLPPNFPIFIPAASYPRDGKLVTIFLVEGYCFVGTGLPEVMYFALEEKPYVNKVISFVGPHGIRALSAIPNQQIQDMKNQLHELTSEDIQEGSRVKITEGIYRSLEGDVVHVKGEEVAVKIVLRSIHVITTLPRVFVEILNPQQVGA